MKILIPYYSRSGHTRDLALTLAAALEQRGHTVTMEEIEIEASRNKWQLARPLLSSAPVLPLFLLFASFRRWWLRNYSQTEQTIKPLDYPNVSQFDCICIGGPKWLYLAYPVARYLVQVDGLDGKYVGVFATFCGPPLKVFELEMLFSPLQQRIGQKGGKSGAMLAISSGFHEFFFLHEMEYVFRFLSWICFRKPLSAYMLDSTWGREQMHRFCDAIDAIENQE